MLSLRTGNRFGKYAKDRVGFRDECPQCDRPLHVCLNCGFYDPAYNNQCRETQAERVVDKDRFNFCEYFRPRMRPRRLNQRRPPPTRVQHWTHCSARSHDCAVVICPGHSAKPAKTHRMLTSREA